MKTFRVPIILSVLFLMLLSSVTVAQPAIPVSSQPLGNLLMTKLSTNAVKIGNCFQGTVSMNVTWTQSNQTYLVSIQAFAIVNILPNQQVSNSTLTSYNLPTNTISSVTLFPDNPITLILSFRNVCALSANNLKLFYIDGTFSFRFSLP